MWRSGRGIHGPKGCPIVPTVRAPAADNGRVTGAWGVDPAAAVGRGGPHERRPIPVARSADPAVDSRFHSGIGRPGASRLDRRVILDLQRRVGNRAISGVTSRPSTQWSVNTVADSPPAARDVSRANASTAAAIST